MNLSVRSSRDAMRRWLRTKLESWSDEDIGVNIALFALYVGFLGILYVAVMYWRVQIEWAFNNPGPALLALAYLVWLLVSSPIFIAWTGILVLVFLMLHI